MLRRLYFRAIQNSQEADYHADLDFPPWGVCVAILRLGTAFLRGCWWRLWWRKMGGPPFIGRGTRIYTSRQLSVGRNFLLEDRAEVVAHTNDDVVPYSIVDGVPARLLGIRGANDRVAQGTRQSRARMR